MGGDNLVGNGLYGIGVYLTLVLDVLKSGKFQL